MAYNNTNKGNDEIIFRIVSRIGVLAEYQTGWTKEVNIVSWNEGTPKIDIRDWNPEHTRLTKGITLYEEEAKKLAELLTDRFNLNKGSTGSNCDSESITNCDSESCSNSDSESNSDFSTDANTSENQGCEEGDAENDERTPSEEASA